MTGRIITECRADRHGTASAYTNSGCRCPDARSRYRRMRKHRHLSDARHIDSTGTIRRIRALQAMGWPLRRIALEAGYSTGGGLNSVPEQTHVEIHVARRVAAVYERLWDVQGPSALSRKWARAAGLWPPMAWAGLDIDDPAADPAAAVDDGLDEVAIERAMRGEPVEGLSRAERAEAFRRLLAAGHATHTAAERLHMSGQRARQLLQEAS